MTGDELTNALCSSIMELSLEERAQLLGMMKAEGIIKGKEVTKRG